ncbi:hypothetical protein FACS1894219_09890 [Clostridia bacterium]|nr:hypothetical protein FACS1894219_09890 [Clostridia bacterium]
MRTPHTMGDFTKQGYASIYELDLSLDDALDYISDPTNFLTVHDGIVRGLNFLGDTGSDDELYASFLRRVKKSKTKIADFAPSKLPETGKAYKWFYASKSGRENSLPSRNDAIKLCFALEMNDLDRAADFLWKVCRLNGFCFRRAEDIVYCYCLANNLDYPTAKDLIKRYGSHKAERQASSELHITRTQTIRDLFGNLQGLQQGDFETLLFVNKHNFLGYSKTAHEKMVEAYNEVKSEIEKERALGNRSAWLSEQVEVRTKDKKGNLNISYRTAKFSEIGELNIVDCDSVHKTIGDDDEFTYSFICRQLAERHTNEWDTDVSVRDLTPNRAYCHYVSDLVSFLTESNLRNVIQKDARATEYESGCARKLFLFLKFAENVLKWERFLFSPIETREPRRKTADKPQESQELFEDFYIGINEELDKCGYGYIYLANPFDWHIMNCVRLLDTAPDDTHGAIIQFNEILARLTDETDTEENEYE